MEENKKKYQVTQEGSLGLLALGYKGLLAWREATGQTMPNLDLGRKNTTGNESESKRKVLVIGWDAADWKVINPLLKQGKLPGLKSLMERGAYGRIQTLDPPLSPMLWTSIATGFRADKHGIAGFIEPTPDGEGLRPVTSTSRKVKAVWNILNQEGYKSNVVAWWPSNPAEPINGVMVSNLYQQANKALGEAWEMPRGTVHPESLNETMKSLRVHPHEITLPMASLFMQNLLNDKKLRKDARTLAVLKTIANAASVHASFTYLTENTDWDFSAVYHDAIDHFCHIAMRYFPPKREVIPQEDFDNYKDIVEAGYRYQDMMLVQTLDMIDENTTVIVLSDHGFHSDHQRPLYIPREPSGPAVEHSPFGIFVIAGPGIKQNHEFSGASVLDVTPTILHYLGKPVGKDMEGKVLHQCFESAIEADYINSWEDVDGNAGMHDELFREDPWAAQEALQQLVELGYIEALDDDKLKEVEKSKRENQYYVARNMINGNRIAPAIEILERIFEESNVLRYGHRLSFAYLSQKMYAKCAEVIEKMKAIEAAQKQTSKTENDPFKNEEFEEPMFIDYLEGMLLLAMNKSGRALPLLERVQQKNPNNLQLTTNIAQIHLLRKNFKAAHDHYIVALAIDDRATPAHYGLGMTLLRQNKYEEAINEFLIAIEQDFYKPKYHFHLGEALVHLEEFEDAEQAFQVCIRLSPGMTKAHKWLVKLYEDHLNMPEKAAEHSAFLKHNIQGEITILSGSDTVGFKAILDALHEGGAMIGDSDKYIGNPNVMFASEWLTENVNKIVYISNRYLNDLPPNFHYKVIYVQKSIESAVQDKAKDLNRKLAEDAISSAIVKSIEKETLNIQQWTQAQPSSEVLFLDVEDLIEGNLDQFQLLDQFLGEQLEIQIIEKKLKNLF
jgi:predicted AlkP superfamily phosphohydrolase/phosphomutase/tetratricopeptide (TPR) repeat protein